MNNFIETFERKHYATFSNAHSKNFERFQQVFKDTIKESLGKLVDDLTLLHEHCSVEQINPLRIKIFHALNNVPDWKQAYYSLAAAQLKEMFGPDISIQIKLNLSIQMPNDANSVLMMHTDTLSGQSPFECVLWTAVTDAFDSNAMYIFDPKKSQKLYEDMPSYQHRGMGQLFEAHKSKANILNAKAGECVIFSSTLFHGNQLNTTGKTRISLNCRFKSLFSPEYASVPHERVTGTFYEPLFLSPITKIGLAYNDHIAF
jgi:sporadic carbohydrate cluster 2OG-Fe(II) oxygenase